MRPAGLDGVLEQRGYRFGSPTEVWTADSAVVTGRVPLTADVHVADEPDGDWLDLWWSVDGRGDDQALGVAEKILSASAAKYAAVRDGDGVAAVGRLAIVGDGSLRASCEQSAAGPLAGRLIVTGSQPLPAVARWLAACDALVLPYRQGWSSNVMERGLLYHRPVIMSEIGGMAEQGHNRAGVTLISSDSELVDALRQTVENLVS